MDASWEIKRYIRKIEENHERNIQYMQESHKKREKFYAEIAEDNAKLGTENHKLTIENQSLKDKLKNLMEQLRDNGGLGRTFI